MSKRMLFAIRARLALALLCWAPASFAQEKFALCKPVETMAYTTRVHVRCAVPVDGRFFFFAVSTQDARFATRMLNLSMVGQVAEKTLSILFDPGDESGAAFGCLPQDCRTARAVGITEAAPPGPPPPPPPPPEPPPPETPREKCLAACEEKIQGCDESQPRSTPCTQLKACKRACPPR